MQGNYLRNFFPLTLAFVYISIGKNIICSHLNLKSTEVLHIKN